MPNVTDTTYPTGVIIPAGGSGTRFGRPRPKQFLELAGIPLLIRTCQAFLQFDFVKQLVVAAPAAYLADTTALLHQWFPAEDLSKLTVVTGGQTRQDSVLVGLNALSPALTLVMVHDAARPLVDKATIVRCRDAAISHGAAIAAIPVKDTLKKASKRNQIEQTVDRSQLWQAQTPQAMQRHLLEMSFAKAISDGFIGTDEASLVEATGMRVQLVEGSERNLKITRPEDLDLAAALLAEKQPMKIGHGFDAHRLVPGRKLILGGVIVEYELGLDGHSDADVVTHALTDALLGALGAGDIGRHFPDTDPQYKGIDSLLLLTKVQELAKAQHQQLSNADITIVCQRPKLAPYLERMQTNLARCCQVAPTAINIKATTTEQMGFTGRGEGIATHAVVLLRSSNEC